jgi:hypothetical protein
MTINGTAQTSFTANAATGVNWASIYAPTAAGTNGQILISNGSGAPSWGTDTNIYNTSGTLSASRVVTMGNYYLQLGTTAGSSTSNIYGKVSIGAAPTNASSKFEVNGSATNTASYSTTGTSIDFTQSNLAATSTNTAAITLSGMKDGGTYTLACTGATSVTHTFSHSGLTMHYVNNAATTASKHTLYTFIVIGAHIYCYMTTGF